MTLQSSTHPQFSIEQSKAIDRIGISGFSSHRSMQHVDLRPLTILAGANSSGKSSIIKPLLLLKQTLDSTSDPGPLQVWGPNVQFESIDQFLTRISENISVDTLSIDIKMPLGALKLDFSRISNLRVGIKKATYWINPEVPSWTHELEVDPRMLPDEIAVQLPESTRTYASNLVRANTNNSGGSDSNGQSVSDVLFTPNWHVRQERCFLNIVFSSLGSDYHKIALSNHPACNFSGALKSIIHVSSAREIAGRFHPALDVASIGDGFPGLFEGYTASIIEKWEQTSDHRLDALRDSLYELKLTSNISTHRRSDVAVEVYVARPHLGKPKRSTPTMVGLADVGLGVSHVLPVLVALESAAPGQIVYIEHPESHLHPRAGYGLAEALVRAAKRGVRVIAETHSPLLLLHIQALIGRRELEASKVALHWFALDSDGFTQITSGQPDEHGRTGDWPEDFADIEMHASSQFIRAARGR